MTEREWQLSCELARTKVTLCETQIAYLQLMRDRSQMDLTALGPVWVPPEPPAEPTI